jgi:hypothetical protein
MLRCALATRALMCCGSRPDSAEDSHRRGFLMSEARSAPSRLGGSNKLVSAQELADRFDVPVATIRHEWRKWGLNGIKIGRHLRFRERDVESWLDRQAA